MKIVTQTPKRSKRTTSRPGRLIVGLATLPLLLSACGQDAAPGAGDDAAAGSAQDSGTPGKPDKDGKDGKPGGDNTAVAGTNGTGRCPAGVSADDLGAPTRLGKADIDGDGSPDAVSVGRVPGGGQGCAVAVLVTTSDGTFAAPVQGGGDGVGDSPLGDPVFAQVDGAAGDETVVTTSWNPRGGGELGMFSWVDGGLVQVQQDGKPWALFATVDDAGGTPRLLSCAKDGSFTDVTAYPPGADAGSTVSTYTLRDGVVSRQAKAADRAARWQQVRDEYPALPRSGIVAFPDCG